MRTRTLLLFTLLILPFGARAEKKESLQKLLAADMSYYRKVSKDLLTPNDRLFILNRIKRKYADKNIALTLLETEIGQWTRMRDAEPAKFAAPEIPTVTVSALTPEVAVPPAAPVRSAQATPAAKPRLFNQFSTPSYSDRLLAILIAVSVLAFTLSLVLMFSAMTLWIINAHDDKNSARQKDRWREIVFNSIDGGAQGSARIEVARAKAPTFVDFLLELAQRFRGEAFKNLESLAAPFLPQIEKLARDGDVYTRAWAVRVLGTFGLPLYLARVKTALNDPSPAIRMIAFRGLILHGYLEYVDELIAVIAAFPKWNLNWLASLVTSLGPQVSDKLREHLDSPKTVPHVKAMLAISLGELHDFRSAASVARVLESMPGRDLSVACLRYLHAAGTAEQAALVRQLCRSSDATIQAQAVRALGRLGDSSDVSLLRECMNTGNRWSMLYSAQALKQIGALDVLKTVSASGSFQASAAREVLSGI